MKTLIQILKLSLAAVIVANIFGCASTGGRRYVQQLYIPPGLDSTTVIKANEVARRNFVSAQDEKLAAEEVKTGQVKLNKVEEFHALLEKQGQADKKMNQSEAEQFQREYKQGERALARWKKLTESDKNALTSKEALIYCNLAQQHFEKAIQINPFDKNARVLLAVTYYNLQNIFGQQQKYEKSIEILERLTRIERGEHDLFRLLAENYLALNNFEQAFQNFKKGMTVLSKTSFEAPPDSSMIFYYLYAQGDALTRMYDAIAAVRTFKEAQNYARTGQEKTDVKNYLAWIDWDGGNIKASEMWDRIVKLESEKQYPQMKQACAELLPILGTKSAKIKANHKLAVVEFEFLDQKKEAIERMHQMYNLTTRKDLEEDWNTVTPFLDAYGAMLYRMGIEARDSQQKKVALAYFTKASSFEWDQIAKAYVEMVALLWNNPEEAIKYGKKALASSEGLSNKEKGELLSLMVRAHKSAGLYDEARTYFNQWKEFSNNQKIAGVNDD